MSERSWVRVPAGATGEFSSPMSTLCADSYFGIRSSPMFTAVIGGGHSASSAVAGYSETRMHPGFA